MSLLSPEAIFGGLFLFFFGTALLIIGLKMPKGKLAKMDIGTYRDRNGILYLAVVTLFGSALLFAVAFL